MKQLLKYCFYALIIISIVIIGIQKNEYYRFVAQKFSQKSPSDTIILHFVHGSLTKKDCIDQRIRIGGKWGGHIEVQIDSMVYSFEIKDKEKGVHLFAQNRLKDFNSNFLKKKLTEWSEETKFDKITSIVIPVEQATKYWLIDEYKQNLEHCPYDYALFGMRCTSSMHQILSESGILEQKKYWEYIFYGFYPKPFRDKMVGFAKKNQLQIINKAGIECRDWE